jgi:hypothetical protein
MWVRGLSLTLRLENFQTLHSVVELSARHLTECYLNADPLVQIWCAELVGYLREISLYRDQYLELTPPLWGCQVSGCFQLSYELDSQRDPSCNQAQ